MHVVIGTLSLVVGLLTVFYCLSFELVLAPTVFKLLLIQDGPEYSDDNSDTECQVDQECDLLTLG